MRALSTLAVVGLLALGCAGLAAAPRPALADTATAGTSAPPLTRLPDWAVPQSYDLALKSDPAQPGYSGTVTIVVDLKQASMLVLPGARRASSTLSCIRS